MDVFGRRKIIYGENGVCTVECIAPLAGAAADSKALLSPSPVYRRRNLFCAGGFRGIYAPVMSRDEAEALIAAIPGIEPAICNDTRFNHVDAFYKQLFKRAQREALVSIVKGLRPA